MRAGPPEAVGVEGAGAAELPEVASAEGAGAAGPPEAVGAGPEGAGPSMLPSPSNSGRTGFTCWPA